MEAYMYAIVLLAFLSFGFLCSCSKKEQPQAHFGPGPDGEETKEIPDRG